VLTKVVAFQARMGQTLSLAEKIHIFKQRPDFVCLPEYCLLDDSVGDYRTAALRKREYIEYLIRLSDELSTCLIAGTVAEAVDDRLYNACYVINRGMPIGRYRKRYPVPGELSEGISPGEKGLVLEVEGIRISVLICGDIFYRDLYDEARRERVDIVFVPTTSPYRPADSTSARRERDRKYFFALAQRSVAYVVKVCGVGKIFGRPLQGRSLIAAPWDFVSQVDFSSQSEKRILTETLDISELREFREKLERRKPVIRDQVGSLSSQII